MVILRSYPGLLVDCSIYYPCFFFSSRRRHTRLVSDWSSDVCSSDLTTQVVLSRKSTGHGPDSILEGRDIGLFRSDLTESVNRSEERRVGKECRSRWSACQ